MIYANLTHEEFKQSVNRANKSLEELLQVYENVFLPMLKKWDGKVYNKRFRTALEQEIEAQGYGKKNRIYIDEAHHGHDEVDLRVSRFNDHERLYIRMTLKYTGWNYLISEAKTLANKGGMLLIDNARKYIEERKDAARNYKKYMRQAEKLQEAIKAYNKLPQCFRENVTDYQFNIH